MGETWNHPLYHGMTKHVDQEGGYALWLPSDWHRFPISGSRQGMIFSPYPDRLDTHLTAEKITLPYAVKQRDMAALREGFHDGLTSLPGVEIESQDETVTSTLLILEARFTFLDGDARRKRWIRNVYWGNGQLILAAQGATEGEFQYWLPMFFNTLMTVEIL